MGTRSSPTAEPPAGRRRRRWRRPLDSVRVRITVAAVLVTTAAVTASGWLLVRSVEVAQLRELRDDINDQIDLVADRLADGQAAQDAVKGPPSAPFVQVVDDDGRAIAAAPIFEDDGETFAVRLGEEPLDGDDGDDGASRDDVLTHRPLPETRPVPLDDEDGRRGGIVLVGSDEVVTSALETISRPVDTPTGTMTVFAAAPVDQVSRSLDALRGALVIGLPTLVVLVGATAWVVVGRALRPVEAIRREVDAITGSTTHRRVPEPATRDEIGRLARTMNAMLGRLDTAAVAQRRFVSDASHELRSPVAAIRTSVEVAREKGARANWPGAAANVLAEESRLEALIDDLLLLAAHDEDGTAAPHAERVEREVDVMALVTAEADRPRRAPVHVVPRGATEGPLVASGDAGQLTRVVANLLDNAARHADSAVWVDVVRAAGTVRVTVDDDGPGVPAADRERIFERFTRLDDGRSRADGGSGLGLAVVRSIVARHHGRVWAEDGSAGGARFVLELPAVRSVYSE